MENSETEIAKGRPYCMPTWATVLLAINEQIKTTRHIISAGSGIKYVTVCQIVDKLKAQGYIEENKRVLSLTESGNKIACDYLPASDEIERTPRELVDANKPTSV